jgi:hypothetical protein
MAQASDLLTLSVVKDWLSMGQDPSASDRSLAMLISQISQTIFNNINGNSLYPKTFTDTVNGTGKMAIMLRNFPVTAILSVTVNGQIIPASVQPIGGGCASDGWMLQQADPEPPGSPQSLYLQGYCFQRGTQNVSVTYVAGYQVVAEPAIAAPSVIVTQPMGPWGSDMGVVNAGTGVALTKVITVPAAGQYAIEPKVAGGYIFGDAGTPVLISYGFCPSDIHEAALEWLAERWAYKSRVGVQSKTLGGQETVSFAISKTPVFIMDILAQYCRVSPF